MKRLLILSAVAAAALASAACVTIIDADGDYDWHGAGAQSFDSARDDCRARAGRGDGSTAFIQCMADKGWTRSKD
jgi:hypothetical protein